jgi:AcrR family transcriptional regulator
MEGAVKGSPAAPAAGPRAKRAYDAPRRRAAAARTRGAILAAARRRFAEHGYAATTMAAIAADAGVALDTVYATVGPKPALFRLLIEAALSGRDEAVPAEARDYVRAIHAEPDAGRKLDRYAAAVADIQPRLAPLLAVLRAAAPAAPELAALWREISARRAANMRRLAHELAATGELRADLSLDEVADVIWATNAAEFSTLLVAERGWTPQRFGRWLADAWRRLLLRRPAAGGRRADGAPPAALPDSPSPPRRER